MISNAHPIITPLSGGVSSEIYLVDDGDKRFVVKKALPKLNVAADWYADVNRNSSEQAYLKYVQQFLPRAVPSILHTDFTEGLFIMEYLGDGFTNWKTTLLQQQIDPKHTIEAARILGSIHCHSWGDSSVASSFDTVQNFYELRLEPYLLATAKKHPKISPLLEQESLRLSSSAVCLVHGDYSPKNILIHPNRMVILDCEVAWYGDPTFDVAFLLSHLLLKSLHFTPNHRPFIQLVFLIPGSLSKNYWRAL